MTIRTPNPINSAQMLLDLQRSKNRLSDFSSQLTTGNRIVNLGDDPTGSALILNFQSSIDQNTQYMSQIDTTTAFLSNTETAASAVGSQVTQLLTLAQQGMNGTMSTSSLTAISQQVDSIYNNLVNLGNTQVQGKYIFAGSRTTTKPFDTAAATPAIPPAPANAVNSLAYQGNNTTISLNVGPSYTSPTNIPGGTLFLGGDPAANPALYGGQLDLFNATKTLSQDLQSGNIAGIKADYANLQAINDHVNNNITQLGGWASGIDTLKSNLTSLNANLQAVQDTVQGVDYPTAITGFTKENVAQQAALKVMSKMNTYNLFDYLA